MKIDRNKKILAAVILLLVVSSFFYNGDEEAIKVLAVKPSTKTVEQTVSNTRAGTCLLYTSPSPRDS